MKKEKIRKKETFSLVNRGVFPGKKSDCQVSAALIW
jgi:hypothetical protein